MAKQHGLTILELMVFLAVMAVLVTVGLPSLQGLIQEQRMVTATNQLVAALNFARVRAVNGMGRVMVCPSTDGASCTGGNRWDGGWIVFTDADHSGQPTTPEDLLRVGPPMEHIHSDSGGRIRTRFKPDGMAHGFNLTIKLCHPHDASRHRAVIVANTGRIRSGPLPGHLRCAVP